MKFILELLQKTNGITRLLILLSVLGFFVGVGYTKFQGHETRLVKVEDKVDKLLEIKNDLAEIKGYLKGRR